MRALDALKRDGHIESIGLCNVNVGQIEEARRITEIAAVQVELSVWKDDNILNGVVAYCLANGIPLLAYRPLGGAQRRARLAADPVLAEIAARHGASACEIALAWLMDLSDSHRSRRRARRGSKRCSRSPRAATIVLDDDDRARLDERFPAGRAVRLREGAPRAGGRSRTRRRSRAHHGPAGRRQEHAWPSRFVARGYARLNRDDAGGSLSDLLPELDRLIASGTSRIVLDNTYVSRQVARARDRRRVSHGLPVRCLWLETSIEDAQVNAVRRMIAAHGRLPGPEEIRAGSKRDVDAVRPGRAVPLSARARAARIPSEGFSTIEVVPFERRRDASLVNKALDPLVRRRAAPQPLRRAHACVRRRCRGDGGTRRRAATLSG